MSSLQCLRRFVNERLTAAAEEIFGAFEKTIVEYEEEVARQRRLLDIVWKPEIKLHRTELPQQHESKEEEVLTEQLLCDQERDSSPDREDPEPLQIKEEREEICTSQEGGQLVLKQETDTFMLTPDNEEGDHREPEPDIDHQLLSHNSPVAESQEQKGSEHVDSGSTRNAEPKPQKRRHKNRSHSNNVYNSPMSKIDSNTHRGEKSFKCDTCGKAFEYKSGLTRHSKIHTGEKPYSCETCGKPFRCRSNLSAHMRIHTGEKPYICNTCEKGFRCRSELFDHMRSHTGEKPYCCKICGKSLRTRAGLLIHMRTHTGEKPYPATPVGKDLVTIQH
ncbi:zinc finger protein 502-like [Xiphias gladius]|uniref:zinc finger protein 502-like n=1 Tax=Xiphias gladius TaxID=8245 RepID=UPI001A9A1A10|nr:zinc finger protein 502-like [Xiphias gladius]